MEGGGGGEGGREGQCGGQTGACGERSDLQENNLSMISTLPYMHKLTLFPMFAGSVSFVASSATTAGVCQSSVAPPFGATQCGCAIPASRAFGIACGPALGRA